MAQTQESTNPPVTGGFQIERNHRAILRNIAPIPLQSIVLILLVVVGRYVPELSPYILLIQTPLALVSILIVPGYLLQALIFPYRNDLDNLERVGLSLGLSLAVISMLALAIDRSPWAIELITITIGQVGVILLLSVLVVIRRMSMSQEIAYEFPRVPAIRSWQFSKRMNNRWRIGGLIVGLLTLALLTGLNFLEISSSRFMTEFYILGVEGLAEDYPRVVEVGEPVYLTAGINNLESGTATYSIRIMTNNKLLAKYNPVSLQAGETWKRQLIFAIENSGEDQAVDILLDRGNHPSPYRALRLWLDVQTP